MDSTAFGMLNSKLMQFSLTRQEATIYLCLMQNKELSGYEVSKVSITCSTGARDFSFAGIPFSLPFFLPNNIMLPLYSNTTQDID